MKGALIGAVMGALFAVPAIFVALISGGAGHGDYVEATALFPVSMLLMPIESDIPFSIAVGLLQFPIYGGLLGWAIVRRNYLPVVIVASMHIVAVIARFTAP